MIKGYLNAVLAFQTQNGISSVKVVLNFMKDFILVAQSQIGKLMSTPIYNPGHNILELYNILV